MVKKIISKYLRNPPCSLILMTLYTVLQAIAIAYNIIIISGLNVRYSEYDIIERIRCESIGKNPLVTKLATVKKIFIIEHENRIFLSEVAWGERAGYSVGGKRYPNNLDK
jgi:hypothetical protein